MPKEYHPYLHYFDASRVWSTLIIGTFPPNREVREGKNSLTDYFYGNKGSLWKILGSIYTEFDFERGTRKQLVEKMQTWQNQYNVGITDTLVSVSRTDIYSADDSDLVLDHEDYNHVLKDYILRNNDAITQIIFTSSKGCNSAFGTFKVIMGADLKTIKATLVTDLPSPSGSSNVSLINVNEDVFIGLHPQLYTYVNQQRPDLLPFFADRWEMKKQKKALGSKQPLPSSPKGLIAEFKMHEYRSILPKQKA